MRHIIRIVVPLFFFSILITSILTIHAFVMIPPVYAQTNETNKGIEYLGVAMKGYYTSLKQDYGKNIEFNIPTKYYGDSLRLISDAGMNHIRYIFYWESYAKNPSLFIKELEAVADKADQYGLKVIYDNHQWHTSSWLESRGTGFPHFLFSGNPIYERDSGGNTDSETAKAWWTNWWDRSISVNGTDGWTLQSNFLKEVVNLLDKHPSTLGYEILSEPQIHGNDQWEKVGQFNTFMVNELRNVTSKTIAYSQQVPAGINEPTIDVTSENMAKMVPANKENVVYKVSLYGVPTDDYQSQRLSILVNAGELAGVPIYIGEWNNVQRVPSGDVRSIDPESSNITPEDIDLFLTTFDRLGVWGAAFWIWNFIPNPTPNFNLITVNDEGQIVPTQYYEMLKNGVAKVSSNPKIPNNPTPAGATTSP